MSQIVDQKRTLCSRVSYSLVFDFRSLKG